MPYDFEGKGLNPADEIVAERQLNKKVFDAGNGKKRYLCHTRLIHYKDENDNNALKEIDHRLTFDNVSKKWKHNKSIYHCEIPEYADEEMKHINKWEGANNQTKFRQKAEHVLGTYVEDSDGSTYVNYPDAFGPGIDLRYYAYWRTVKRVIIFNSAPADVSNLPDLSVEVSLPDANAEVLNTTPDDKNKVNLKRSAVVVVSKGLGKIEANPATDVTGKKIFIGTLESGYSFFNPVSYNDDAKKGGMITTFLAKDGSDNIIIQSNLSEIDFDNAVYPLRIEG